jgi:WD repeat-containing protein 61
MNFTPQFHIRSHSSAVYGLSKGEEPHIFYSASGDGYLASWNLHSGEQGKFAVNVGQPVFSVHFVHKYHHLLAGTQDGGIHVIDRQNKKELRLLQGHQQGVFHMMTNAAENLLFVSGGDGLLTIWSIPDYQLIRSIPLSENKIRQITVCGENIVCACNDGTIRILEPHFYNEIKTIEAHEGGTTMVAAHPTKPALISGGKDALIKTYDINNDWKTMLTLPAHNFAVYAMVFDDAGQIAFTASRDKTIKIWDAGSFDPLQRLDAKSGGHTHSVNKIIFTGQRLVSAGDDRQIIIWQ